MSVTSLHVAGNAPDTGRMPMKPAVFKPCHGTSRGVCREEMLHALVAHAVAVKEVRLIRDKFTGQPRGFCFMEFHSISDAAIALQLLQVLPAASYFRSFAHKCSEPTLKRRSPFHVSQISCIQVCDVAESGLQYAMPVGCVCKL